MPRTFWIAALLTLTASPAAAIWDCEVTIQGRNTPYVSQPHWKFLVEGTYEGVALAYLRRDSGGSRPHGSARATTAEGEQHTDNSFGLIGKLDLARDYNPNWSSPNHFVHPVRGLDLSATDQVTVTYHGSGGLYVGIVAPGTPQSAGNLSLSDVYAADINGRVTLDCTRVE